MRKSLRTWIVLVLLAIPFISKGQAIEMANTLRSEGKIYVVVGVIAIIFVGLVFYLISMDRRVTKMESRDFGKK